MGMVRCLMPGGQSIRVPVIPGLLKHLTANQLRHLLKDPDVVRKYTIAALNEAPWPVLREFPPEWLARCTTDAHLKPSRARAIIFLLA